MKVSPDVQPPDSVLESYNLVDTTITGDPRFVSLASKVALPTITVPVPCEPARLITSGGQITLSGGSSYCFNGLTVHDGGKLTAVK